MLCSQGARTVCRQVVGVQSGVRELPVKNINKYANSGKNAEFAYSSKNTGIYRVRVYRPTAI